MCPRHKLTTIVNIYCIYMGMQYAYMVSFTITITFTLTANNVSPVSEQDFLLLFFFSKFFFDIFIHFFLIFFCYINSNID